MLNTGGSASSSTEQIMCYIEQVYHRPCRHWGRDRFAGEPCCRSRFANDHPIACTYAEKIGSVDSSELCSNCKYRLTTGGAWRPFADVLVLMQTRSEEKLQHERKDRWNPQSS
jgi:hypothetical protein